MASQDRSSMEISVEDEEMNRRLVTAHEFAHSFGKLKDEYYEPDARYSGNTGAPNCLPKDEALEAWKQWYCRFLLMRSRKDGKDAADPAIPDAQTC